MVAVTNDDETNILATIAVSLAFQWGPVPQILRKRLFGALRLGQVILVVNDGKMEASEVEFLINGGSCVDPGNMGPLHEWMDENIWKKVKALESMPRFKGIGDSMQSDSDDWGAWFDVEKGKFGLLRCLLSLAPSIILTHLARSLRAHDTQWKK